MQEWLQGYLAGKIPPGEVAILYDIGDEFSGETHVQFSGDGAYALWSTATAGRARRDFSGRVNRDAVRAVAQELLAAQVWEVRHVRRIPGEDDPEAVIAVQRGAAREAVVLWVSEIDLQPAFARAQDAILQLARGVSAGEVLEAGR